MALIEVDSSQAKTVTILLLILVIAGVSTAVRMRSRTAGPASAVVKAIPTSAASVSSLPVARPGMPVRNPFKKPTGFSPGTDGASTFYSARGVVASITEVDRHAPVSQVQPAAVGELPPFEKESTATGFASVEPARPQLELLATVHGPNGWTAVIRWEGAETKIVGVGDVLGSYRVQRLESTRAYLRKLNGMPSSGMRASRKKGSDEVVVVKRPPL